MLATNHQTITVREMYCRIASPAQQHRLLEEHDGRIDAFVDELWVEKNGSPPTYV